MNAERCTTLVGLHVVDDPKYTAYRNAMTPILTEYGGGFGYDFKVGELLKSEVPEAINRVFTIWFPNEEVMAQFFADPAYLSVKRQFFDDAVASTTLIGRL